MALTDSIVGCLLRRPSLSIGLAAQPPPAPVSWETVISAPDPSSHKRARRGEIGNDSGRIEGDRDSPRSEPAAIKARAEEGARPEAPVGAVPSPTAVPETDSTLARETTPARATAPLSSAAEGVAAGDDAAAHVSSNRLAERGRARSQRKQRKRPRRARGHWSPRGRLPGPLPTPGPRQTRRLWRLWLRQGLARLLTPCSSG
jgi:hypothetical protein